MEYLQITEKLKTMLDDQRYQHSVGVMHTAVALAEIYGADTAKAQIAGLLHDCAKNIPMHESHALCERYGIMLDTIALVTPKLTHQHLGMAIAKHDFGVDDIEVLQAIGCHTTAKLNMTTLEKIIYLADFIEPNRGPMKGLEELREIAYSCLDDAMLYALDISIKIQIKKGVFIHPNTIWARNEIVMAKLAKLS